MATNDPRQSSRNNKLGVKNVCIWKKKCFQEQQQPIVMMNRRILLFLIVCIGCEYWIQWPSNIEFSCYFVKSINKKAIRARTLNNTQRNLLRILMYQNINITKKKKCCSRRLRIECENRNQYKSKSNYWKCDKWSI